MKLYFSWKVTLTCGALVALMLRASLWQYHRFIDKQEYIITMQARLNEPVTPLSELVKSHSASVPPESPQANSPISWESLTYRRVLVEGIFDFSHEMLLRNRRLGDISGSFALTPLRLEGIEPPTYVLVSRGFIPLAKADPTNRKEFQRPLKSSFTALVKESSPQKFLAPKDPPSGSPHPWVDRWLRVDIPRIEAQLPYKLLPVYLEIMDAPDRKGLDEKILSTKAGREELFFLGDTKALPGIGKIPDLEYPVPIYDTVIPAGRHFGYIFEWLMIALLTILAGIILQLRPPRNRQLDPTISRS